MKENLRNSSQEEWIKLKLGNLFDIDKEQLSKDNALFMNLPYIGLENIEANTRRYIVNNENENGGQSTCFLFDDRHVLYGKLRPYLNKVYLPDKPGRCSMELLPLRPKPEFSREFLAFILQSPPVISYATKHSTGGRMPRANINELIKLEVLVPTKIRIQENILKELEKKTYEAEKMRLAALRQKEAAEALKEKILIKEFPFRNGDILPAGWSIFRCQEIIDVRDGTHDTPTYIETGIPLVTSKNLRNGEIDFQNVKFISADDHNEIERRSRVDKGDILFAMIGTIGNPVIVKKDRDFSIKNVALFKFKNSPVIPEYFHYLLFSEYIKAQLLKATKGGIQNFVSLQFLRDMSIPIPADQNIQKEIVSRIKHHMVDIKKVIQSGEKQLEAIQSLPAAILRETFDFQEPN